MTALQTEKVEQQTPSPWPALAALMVGFFMLMLDTTIVVVAIPKLSADLHTGISTTVWATSVYLLANSVPLLLSGRLGDRFGPKRIYLIGMAVFTVSSLLCGLSSNIGELIAFRGVQGLGAALMAPQSMAAISRIFPKNMRGRAMSYWGLVSGAAILIGPISGGLLIDSLGWRSIFFINVPIGIAGLFVAQRLIPSLPGKPHRFDFFGVALSAVAMFCFVFGLENGSGYNWSKITNDLGIFGVYTGISLYVYEVLGLGVIFAILFVVWESKNKNEPLVPLGIFQNRTFSAANLAIVAAGFSITAASFPGTLYFQVGRGMTPAQAALMMLPSAIVSVPLAPQIGKLVDKVGPKWPAFAGLVIFSSALFMRHFLMTPDMSLLVLLGQAAFMGAGSSLMMSPLAVAAMHSLPPQMIGAGSGVFNTSRTLGSTIGAAVIATVMTSELKSQIASHIHTVPTGQRDALTHINFQQMTAGNVAERFTRTVVSATMANALLWPAFAMAIATVLVLFLRNPSPKD
jgi:EmrB/QacA subfamily drug resistance transporter